jgi:membrane associated rhomboid family serine protease
MNAFAPRGRGFGLFPPVIKFLLVSNVAIWLVQTLFLTNRLFAGAPVDDLVMSLFALQPLESGSFWPWQLITYQFMHDTSGFMHIFFNMFALWMFGMELEQLWGARRFAGIFAGVTQLVVDPLTGGGLAPTVGASGSIFGVLIAFGMTFPDRPVLMFPIFFPVPARIFVLIYAGMQLVSGLLGQGANDHVRVAHFAHLGGAVAGFLLIKFGAPLFDWIERLGGRRRTTHVDSERLVDVNFRDVPVYDIPQRRDEPMRSRTSTPTRFVVDGEPITQETIDEILDKISVAGYHNLTEREKRILDDVSRQL